MAKRKRGANKAGANGDHPSKKRAKADHLLSTDVEQIELDLKLDKSPFPDTLTGEDRRREAKLYDLLGSADPDDRIAAADALVTGLSESSEQALQRHLDTRLFRGLASSRNASRLGFSLVLTQILNKLFGPESLSKTKYPKLTFDKVLDILLKNTAPHGQIPASEERDHYFGRLFGLHCFVTAEIIFDDDEQWPKILDLILKMADKKVWLRSYCGWIIAESLPQMGQGRAETTLQKLSASGLDKTAEGIGIWIKARTFYPRIEMPGETWEDVMSCFTCPRVTQILIHNVAQDTGETVLIAKGRQGSWNPQLHFVWDHILATLAAQNPRARKTRQCLRTFWGKVVDSGLFSHTATDQQKFRGFLIFHKFLLGFAEKNQVLVRFLFTDNLMGCLMNQAAKEDRYLHRAAVKSLDVIRSAVETNHELLLPVLAILLGIHGVSTSNGVYNFDQRTGSSVVSTMMQWATPDNAKAILKLLRDPISGSDRYGHTGNKLEKFRQVYARYVYSLATSAPKPQSLENPISGQETSTVAWLAFNELASCAYSVQPQFMPDLSESSRQTFRTLLVDAVGQFISQGDSEHLCHAVISIMPTAVNMSDEINAERETALKSMKECLEVSEHASESTERNSVKIFRVLALLYAVGLLQLYDGAPDAITIFQDLKRCRDFGKNNEDDSSKVLVEVLLSLANHKTRMARMVSEEVFLAWTSTLTADALECLMVPLLSEENLKGFQDLFDDNLEEDDTDMEDAEASDSADEVGDEDEGSELLPDNAFPILSDGEASDNAKDDENEDEDEHQEGDESFEEAIGHVLKSHRLDQDNDAQPSDSDADMTDSEMMALDAKLADIFKQMIKKEGTAKRDRKHARQSIIDFKYRVFGLVLVYAKIEEDNPLVFNLLLPLLGLARTTTDKSLANKASLVITKLSAAYQKKNRQSQIRNREIKLDAPTQLELLKQILAEVGKGSSNAYVNTVSAASLLVATTLVAIDERNTDSVTEVYADLFTDCQRGRVQIPGSFFNKWINWGMSLAAQEHQQRQETAK
ncbi:DNA polymerase phi-domain-containing protein [Hypoxylon sp. NC1633]|nr:DNA polymerase phi-domain-containing protein [Hypoxylon sp. NC1633]